MYDIYIGRGKVASRRKLNSARLWVVDNLEDNQTAYILYVPSYWQDGQDAEGKATKFKKKDTMGTKTVGIMKYDGRRDRYLWWPWNDKLKRQLANRYGDIMAPAYIVMSDGSVMFDQETAHMYDKEHTEAKVRKYSGMPVSDFEKSMWAKVVKVEDDKDWSEVMAKREEEMEEKIRQKREKRRPKE